MAKQQAEGNNRLSIFFLKKHGYFDKDLSWKAGTITWTYGYSENKSSIGITMRRDNWNTPNERTFIKLNYTHTDHWSGEKSDMNFNVELTTTPCRYGGKRYWFVCPLTKNGRYCGRRVGVIYGIGKWFGCRRCGNIAYASQMKGGRFRGSNVTVPDIEKLEEETRRYYYKGKPTRKYRRLIRMNQKLSNDIIMISGLLGNKR